MERADRVGVLVYEFQMVNGTATHPALAMPLVTAGCRRLPWSKMKITKKLWIGILILAILSPVGLILPALFNAGGAWGEWSAEELKKITGYIPEGMRKLADAWKSPLQGYEVPGQGQGLVHRSFGYVFTALLGIAAAAGLAYLLAKVLGRKDRK